MEYTKKHRNLIAKLFKKAGMLEEANIVFCQSISKSFSNKTTPSIPGMPMSINAAE